MEGNNIFFFRMPIHGRTFQNKINYAMNLTKLNKTILQLFYFSKTFLQLLKNYLSQFFF